MAECPVVATTRSAVHEGVVYVIDKQDEEAHVKCYLKGFCIGADGQPARLLLFENSKQASKGKPVLREIQFSVVKSISSSDINKHEKKLIVIVVGGEDVFLFFVKSEDDHAKWLGYCKMLFTLPQYIIPEIPKRNLVSKECASKYTDPSKFNATHVFVVYLINEGVASVLNLSGLHIIAVSKTTFSIYAYHTEKLLVTWDQDKIRRPGKIESLVFIEPGRKCQGGPGLLWMYCSCPRKLRECLHQFLYFTPFMSEDSVFVDPEISSTYLTSTDSRQLLQIKGTDQNIPPANQGWYFPPSSKSKAAPTSVLLTGKSAHGVQTSHSTYPQPTGELASQDDSSFDNNFAEFRSRSKVISKSQGDEIRLSEGYSKLRSKRQINNEPPPLPPRPPKHSSSTRRLPPPPPPPPINDRFRSSDSSSLGCTCCQRELSLQGTHFQNGCSRISLQKSLEEMVFDGCAVLLIRKLDIMTILAHLLARHLLSNQDYQFLNNLVHTNDAKVHYLLYTLPRKSDGWLKAFISCLRDSEEGTGHKEIADTLEAKLKEAEDNGITPTLPIPASSDTDKPIQVTSDTDKSYPVFIESPSAVDIMEVLPSDSVESLLIRVREKFNISSAGVNVEMEDSQLCSRKSVRESQIYKYSYLVVCVL